MSILLLYFSLSFPFSDRAFFSASSSLSSFPSPSSSTSTSSLSFSASPSISLPTSSSLSTTLLRFFNRPDGPVSGISGGDLLCLAAEQLGHLAFQNGQPLASRIGPSFPLHREGLSGVGASHLGVVAGFTDNRTPLTSLHLARDLLAPASFAGSPFIFIAIAAIVGIPTNQLQIGLSPWLCLFSSLSGFPPLASVETPKSLLAKSPTDYELWLPPPASFFSPPTPALCSPSASTPPLRLFGPPPPRPVSSPPMPPSSPSSYGLSPAPSSISLPRPPPSLRPRAQWDWRDPEGLAVDEVVVVVRLVVMLLDLGVFGEKLGP
ncbi:hypothetical protein EV359DRAFT_88200 [Lentinula novae-zelandiae]|nr:hypothetical protein EV359DRAFT_88200 [Lentinula novae-zelandiae]